jgi:predicted O-methyltransferase YrrM
LEFSIDGVAQNYFHLGKVAQFLGSPALLVYAGELLDRNLVDRIETEVADVPEFETKHFRSVFDFRFYRFFIYAVTRALRPKVFVETGVLHGLTSMFILDALDKNKAGKLISADLPSYPDSGPSNKDGYFAVLPRGKEPGWVVPESMRANWLLLKGASTDVLPAALAESGPVDIFLHDSEHTAKTMYEELRLGWEALRPGGLLICDNFDMSSAFTDLVEHWRCPFLAVTTSDHAYDERLRTAIAVKPQ